MTLEERMPMLLEMRREHLVTLRANAADPAKDVNGCSSSSVMGTLRFIGVAEFVVSQNVDSFREFLSEAARIKINHFERYVNGEPIDDSYIAMLAYEELFDALAAGDFDSASKLAKLMGGRSALEKRNDHPFDHCLGYTLRAFVLGNPSETAEWAPKFAVMCEEKSNRDFSGYAQVFQGMLTKDLEMAQSGLSAIEKGHKNQSKRGVFRGREDETLSVWGVGIANLCRHVGLAVEGISPLIPQALLL